MSISFPSILAPGPRQELLRAIVQAFGSYLHTVGFGSAGVTIAIRRCGRASGSWKMWSSHMPAMWVRGTAEQSGIVDSLRPTEILARVKPRRGSQARATWPLTTCSRAESATLYAPNVTYRAFSL